ncbi:MAG: amidohydrolase family protein, partial [Lachnospiraceae bacterium]|nr:amidohydrolase family protein [Lachnospiraceae bacterium]
MIIKNGMVFTEENKFFPLSVLTEGDKITSLVSGEDILPTPEDDETVVDAFGCYVIPGLTDIHFHGCDGYDFCDSSMEAVKAIAAFSLKNGVTSICPATMTMPPETLDGICKTAAAFSSEQKQKEVDTDFADLVGIHMEGPFISREKKGAQNEAHILSPNGGLVEHWMNLSDGLVKLISLAPELPNALPCIEKFKDKVAFSLAHTGADYAAAKAAMDAGANHVTHLYTAMPPL